MEHGGGLRGFGFEFVAFGASVGTGEFGTGGLAFCGPPTGTADAEFGGKRDAAGLRGRRLRQLCARGETSGDKEKCRDNESENGYCVKNEESGFHCGGFWRSRPSA